MVYGKFPPLSSPTPPGMPYQSLSLSPFLLPGEFPIITHIQNSP